MKYAPLQDLIENAQKKKYELKYIINEKSAYTYVFQNGKKEINIMSVKGDINPTEFQLGVFYIEYDLNDDKIICRPIGSGPCIITWNENGDVVDEVFAGPTLTAPRGRVKSTAAYTVVNSCGKNIPTFQVKPGPNEKISKILCDLNDCHSVTSITGKVWPKSLEEAQDLILSGKVKINDVVCKDINCWMLNPSSYVLHVDGLYLIKIIDMESL